MVVQRYSTKDKYSIATLSSNSQEQGVQNVNALAFFLCLSLWDLVHMSTEILAEQTVSSAW